MNDIEQKIDDLMERICSTVYDKRMGKENMRRKVRDLCNSVVAVTKEKPKPKPRELSRRDKEALRLGRVIMTHLDVDGDYYESREKVAKLSGFAAMSITFDEHLAEIALRIEKAKAP